MGYRKILIVEDDPSTLNNLKLLLEMEDFAVDTAPDLETAKRKLSKHRYPLILLDLFLPDGNGMELLPLIDKEQSKVVILTAHGDVSTAVKAVREGAFDFLEKPIKIKNLVQVLEKALRELGREQKSDQELLSALVGNSKAVKELKEKIKELARSGKNVLIRGEEGVGKTFVAELIHKLSPRSSYPLVKVVVRGKDEFQLEKELFGSRIPGKEQEGAFERAEGGTVLLIGVEELPEGVQKKLKKVLETKKYVPLGDNSEKFFNCAIISTASKNLYQMVEAGKFDEELLLKLDQEELEIPPLRERKEDVIPLLEHFLELFASEKGFKKPLLSEEVYEFLMNYEFPGNVRELKNLAERLVLVHRGKVVGINDLNLSAVSKKEELFDVQNWREAKKKFEREFLKRKLIETGGDVKKVAKMINLDISNVYRKIKEYGLEDYQKK